MIILENIFKKKILFRFSRERTVNQTETVQLTMELSALDLQENVWYLMNTDKK